MHCGRSLRHLRVRRDALRWLELHNKVCDVQRKARELQLAESQAADLLQ